MAAACGGGVGAALDWAALDWAIRLELIALACRACSLRRVRISAFCFLRFSPNSSSLV